jgi:spore maturation protein CgeB
MFEIYKTARIVLNDYGLLAGGQGMNQRIYEVLGIGGFLLTRNSAMFTNWEGSVATYENADDCIQKIDYYLSNKEERNRMAKKGQDFVLAHFNYKHIMEKLSNELEYEYNRKFRA